MRKIRHVFRRELVVAANGHVLDDRLHDLILSIFHLWFLDTQEVEGLSSTMKHIMKIAPYTGWDLLSARTMARKWIKWYSDSTDEYEEEFLKRCVSFHKEVRAPSLKSWGKRFSDIALWVTKFRCVTGATEID